MGAIVTVGIPFLNPGKRFESAIRSVFAQTIRHWEMILIDDGSTDGSVEFARRIQDSRVKLISDGERRQLPARLNQLAVLARTPLLARMDADDLMAPRRLERQCELLGHCDELSGCFTGCYIVDQNNRLTGTRGLYGIDTEDKLALLRMGLYLHPSLIGRTKWFLNNPYSPNYPRAEDRELWVRTFGKARFQNIGDPLYYYLFHNNVRLAAYLQSYRSERMILRRYGPALVGRIATWCLLCRSLAKTALLPAIVSMRCGSVISKINCHEPSYEEAAAHAEGLSVIASTAVPGWS